LRSYKKEIYFNIVGGFFGLILLLAVLFEVIYDFAIKQEIKKAKLVSDVIIDFREYISKVSPYVTISNRLNHFSCTPAYVVNKVSSIIRDKNHFLVRQVSDDYRNQLDKPNQLELQAINYFKDHPNKDEFFKIEDSNFFTNRKIFYARVLKIESACLKCHGVPKKDVPPRLYKLLVKEYGDKAFNYKVGDVRGIISIYAPFEDVFNILKEIIIIFIVTFLFVFIVGTLLFKRISDNIREDVEKIINHFKEKIAKKKLSKFKEKMHYTEMEILKDEVNSVVKELKHNQKEIYKKYYYNQLTNLFNRTKFLQIEYQKKYPLVLLNINKLREINSYFGVEITDKLIQQVAQRLKDLRKVYKFKLYHIFIDEFILLFSHIEDKEELLKIVKDILNILEKDYIVDNYEITIRFRAGVSFYQKSYLCAEMALEAAKEKNIDIEFCSNVKFYLESCKKHLEWLKILKKKIEKREVIPFYQPIVDKNKKIIKYESLVRIITDYGEVISPYYFLDVAKKTRFYSDITKIMVSKTIEKIKELGISISVNLSLEDIENKEVRNFILNKINELEDKSLLILEIVETEKMRNSEEDLEFFATVKKLGVKIYIDDFGSGYSNFDYLFKLCPDGVKIDGSLIKNILSNKTNQTIVKTIVSFAKETGIEIVAEFVENEEIFNYLKNLGVDYFQGYYFSPPREKIIYEI